MTYVRPTLNPGEYLDESGSPIPYGRRWDMGSPPDETYSVTRHPERFAPLLDVARALREHLIETYDVTVDGDRLVPSDSEAATLTLEVTDQPSVRLFAGLGWGESAPPCACDACDDDLEEAAKRLESRVFAVVSGGFQESWQRGGMATTWGSGEEQGSGWIKTHDKVLRKALKARGRNARYAPWPLRSERG